MERETETECNLERETNSNKSRRITIPLHKNGYGRTPPTEKGTSRREKLREREMKHEEK